MDRRTLSGSGVPLMALLWVITLTISIYHLFTHDAPLLPTILGQWSLFLASLLFGVIGYHVLRKADSARERDQISAYTVGLFVLAGLAAGGYATHQYLSPLTRLPLEGILFQALFVALIGGTAGMYVGLGVARRARHASQLTALNNLHKIALDVNRKLASQTTRAEIEQAVCDRLAESGSYEFAWVGDVDDQANELVSSTTADIAGCFDYVLDATDGDATGRDLIGTALRTGETQVIQHIEDDARHDPRGERARKQGINCSAAVPVTYEEESYGALTVYTTRENAFNGAERQVVSQLGELMGLAIAAVEREQQVAHERERLEFVNRLIRHNLLNGLNVVQARSTLLQSHIDLDGQEHLSVVRERTDDMVDLIQTLRSLMQVLVLDEDHQLEAVCLRSVLRDELDRVQQTFDDATFDVQGDLATAGRVMGDDLLGKVFWNILVNAVQHNDADVAQVTIDVESDDEAVTVRIADNGPGIPDDLRDRLFERGEKSFSSPGTGFGLYLVREIIEGYGGTITVSDNQPTGAIFSLTLPRVD